MRGIAKDVGDDILHGNYLSSFIYYTILAMQKLPLELKCCVKSDQCTLTATREQFALSGIY